MQEQVGARGKKSRMTMRKCQANKRRSIEVVDGWVSRGRID